MHITPSAMKVPVSKNEMKKHYSFLNPLDDITVPSANLSLTPNSMLQAEKEASIRRLSAALHTLAGEHDSKQLPVLPVPSYNNGIFDLGHTYASEPVPEIAIHDGTYTKYKNYTQGFKHLPKISLGENFSVQPSMGLADEVMDGLVSPTTPARSAASRLSHKRTSSEAATVRVEKRFSARLSRPISMYGVSRRQTVTDGQRPMTSTTTTDASRDRKRSITYSDQRCSAPARDKEPARPATATQSPRRRFKIPASFRDLNFKSERRRRLPQTDSPPPPVPPMRHSIGLEADTANASSHLTIQQALAFSPSIPQTYAPLHDESESKKFTRDCMKSLALKPDPPKSSNTLLQRTNGQMTPSPLPKDDTLLGPRLPLQSSTLPSSFAPSASLQVLRRTTHAHRFSEAESISSSILDYDWPQPEAYRTTADLRRRSGQDHGKPRPDSGLGGLLNVMNVSTYQQGPFYPPPNTALPPTPGTKSTGSQMQSHVVAATNRNHSKPSEVSEILLPPVAFQQLTNPGPKSRLTALAESKGLQMNLDVTQPNEPTSSDGEDAGPVLTSPLRLRSQRSHRSVRIDSLRRKHLSIHGKDGLIQSINGEYYEDATIWARRGSAPDKMESVDSYHRLSKQSFHRRCTSNDKSRRASQCLSPTSRHSRQNSRSSVAVKAVSSRVQKVSKHNARLSKSNMSYPEALVTEPSASKASFHRHSRQYSAESQPSTARSSASTTLSADTEVTLPSPVEDGNMSSNTIAGHPYSQSTVRVRSPLVPDFESHADKQAALTKLLAAIQSEKSSTGLPAVPKGGSKREEDVDGIGRSQRNVPLTTTRSATERDLQQRRVSRKRQARAQLAHDLQFELDQLEQMKRVYRAMHSARDRDRASGQGARSYAQLLDDDRFAAVDEIKTWTPSDSVKLSSRRTSHVIAKIEADLKHSPPKYQRIILDESDTDFRRRSGIGEIDQLHRMEDEAMPPTISPVKTRSISPPQPPNSAKKLKNAGFSLFPNDKTPPKAQDLRSPTMASSSTDSSFKSSQLKKPKSPSSTISSLDSKKSRKRYSLTSIYNTTTPQYSPTSSVFSEYRTPGSRSYSRQQQLTPPPEGRELHIAATIMSPHVSQDFTMDVVVNTSKIDQVIDTFTTGKQ